ncbi:metallophosphoesterase family protein [Paucilactobacillus kaifaensis]|uniref:metallophosphoesterase family protein n=1 Tax=Paucilactobacillus kaifaensis TaxID=2559921 RepID=UPI0010F8D248|nr:metallophosphoesterase family protein [Paucilactobacillus kaifaensis]
MRFITADTHFFHESLLGKTDFAIRPYANVEQMNQDIIDHWNERVEDKDTVYHLGDIALYFTHPAIKSNEAVLSVLKQLNGHLVLIKGNHDSRELFKFLDQNNYLLNDKPKFEFHDVGVLFKYDHRQYYLTHYPMMLGIAPQIINLHGHIHHYAVPAKENINVGVDTPETAYLDYHLPFGAPLSLADIEQMVDGKKVDFDKRR